LERAENPRVGGLIPPLATIKISRVISAGDVSVRARTKHVEYRKIKPYWTRRLRKVGRPFRLVLRNGMSPPIPVVTVRIDRVATNSRTGNYLLQIGRVLRVEHWDRKRQRPR